MTARGVLRLLLAVFLLTDIAIAAPQSITLGVFAFRPKPIVEARFRELAEHMSEQLGDVSVRLEVLDLAELEDAVARNRIDLVLTNPRHYLLLRSENALSGAIATLNARGTDGTATHSLGGVIFTLAERDDIATLGDIRGRNIAVPSTKHMGGFQCQAFELRQADIRVEEDNQLLETGNHDAAVRAVLDGRADVGFVRTGILEDMARIGAIDLRRIKVINAQALRDFPFMTSTRLYPEWPVIAMPRLEQDLVRRISATLLALEPWQDAAVSARISGFVPPQDYHVVETFARVLRLPPFNRPPEVSWPEFWRQHQAGILLGLLALSALLVMSALLINRHARLRVSTHRLSAILNRQREQLDAEQLVSRATTTLLNAGVDQRDVAIGQVLEIAGNFLHADRAYVFEFREDGDHVDNTHEWCVPGVVPVIERNQSIHRATSPWWWHRLERDGHLAIADVDSLPEEASAERDALRSRQIRSVFNVALRRRGETAGMIGFDAVRRRREWSESETHLLNILADAMSSAMERWHAEISVQQSEVYFRTLFESNVDGILIADVETRELAMANPAMCRMLGYDADELRGMSVTDVHPPENLDQVLAGFVDQAAGEVHLIESVPVLRKDGSVFFADIDAGALSVAGRNYLLGLFRDTSERRQAEEELRLLKFALDQTEEAAYLVGRDGYVKYVNEGASRMLGYTRQELLGLHVADLDADFSASEWPGHFDFLRESGALTFERQHRRKDGSTIAVEVNANYMRYQEQEFNLGLTRDITARKATEAALRDSEARLSLAGRAAFDLIYEWDPARHEIRWFGDIDQLLGYPPETLSATPEAWLAYIHPDDQGGLAEALTCRRTATELMEEEYRIRHQDGQWRVWSDRALPILDDETARPVRWVGVCADITERRHAEEKLRLAASVFTHAREGILITDADGVVVDANEACADITGHPRAEIVGKNPRVFKSGLHGADFYRRMWHELSTTGGWSGELWNRRKDGELYAESLTISAVRDQNGSVRNYVGLFSDITAQKRYEKQLEHIAHYDALTDLPNRMLLADRLHHAMAQARRRGRYLAVVYLDLDGFKAINDRHGHDVGDRMLVALATRMKDALREGDTIARLGGDEFVAVLTDLDGVDATNPVIERLLAAAAKPIRDHDVELQVSASLGVTFYPQGHDVDADQLLRQSDQAMYQAKVAGKNRYFLFDPEQDRSVRGLNEQLASLREGLQLAQFELHFQPKVNMRTGAVIGAEALLRWNHPELGLLHPGEFLPMVQDHPLAVQLDDWAIRNVLAQMTDWQALGLTLGVSVNVSALQLQQDDFLKKLRAMLAQYPTVSPDNLELEILETSALADLARVSRVIRACRDIGVNFALDDFGTGYSSLSYLKKLPAADLKIDQSFVRDMLQDAEDLAILDGIIGLATAFRRQVIAEGVETVEHGELLLLLGCERAQGYVIAAPMPAAELPAWIDAWRPAAVWKHARAVARADLPAIFAAVEHRAWTMKVEAYLSGNRATPPNLNPHTSRFGQWWYGDGLSRYGAQAEAPILERLHEESHDLAATLIREAERGEPETALQRIDELVDTSARLLASVKRLLR